MCEREVNWEHVLVVVRKRLYELHLSAVGFAETRNCHGPDTRAHVCPRHFGIPAFLPHAGGSHKAAYGRHVGMQRSEHGAGGFRRHIGVVRGQLGEHMTGEVQASLLCIVSQRVQYVRILRCRNALLAGDVSCSQGILHLLGMIVHPHLQIAIARKSCLDVANVDRQVRPAPVYQVGDRLRVKQGLLVNRRVDAEQCCAREGGCVFGEHCHDCERDGAKDDGHLLRQYNIFSAFCIFHLEPTYFSGLMENPLVSKRLKS